MDDSTGASGSLLSLESLFESSEVEPPWPHPLKNAKRIHSVIVFIASFIVDRLPGLISVVLDVQPLTLIKT
jgi:hypothetical protein